MEYKNTDLLSPKHFGSLVTTNPNEKARILCSTMKRYCCIKDSNLYVLQPNLT